MGALANRIKESTLGRIFEELKIASIAVIKFLDEDKNDYVETVDEAIEETKKEYPGMADLEKVRQIAIANDKVLDEMAERFDDEEYFKTNVDEDGYNKLENKLENIKAEVSEENAMNLENNSRIKGDKPKTRVDED